MKTKKILLLLSILLLPTLIFAQKTITIHFDQEIGYLKDLMGVNKSPLPNRNEGYLDAAISSIRMHDFHGANDYCFYSHFWNFDQENKIFTSINHTFDPDDPNQYNWGDFDNKVSEIIDLGMEPFIRLGSSYPNPNTILEPMDPPLDEDGIHFTKFASLCKKTAMHITGDWDNGLRQSVQYWEVWNEPDGIFWTGSPIEFFRMFKSVMDSIKSFDPTLSVGGPGVTPKTAIGANSVYLDNFLDYLRDNHVSLDFYSWHLYGAANPYSLNTIALDVRNKLDSHGFSDTESCISEINYDLDEDNHGFVGTAKGAAYYASTLITAQNSPIDKLFWYPGNGFFNDETNNEPNLSWGGYALKSFGLILSDTPVQIQTDGGEFIPASLQSDTTNLMILAGKSEDENRVYILISNYNSDYSNFSVVINHLPWAAGDTIFYRRNVIKEPSDKFSETEISLVGTGTQSLEFTIENMPAPSVILFRLERKAMTSVDEQPQLSLPKTCTLLQNYPNPFNSSTAINYSLVRSSDVNLTVFNSAGQQICCLIAGQQNPGSHTVIWNGTDDSGQSVSSGIYFYQSSLEGSFGQTKKILLLK